jgi:hypothetical protein
LVHRVGEGRKSRWCYMGEEARCTEEAREGAGLVARHEPVGEGRGVGTGKHPALGKLRDVPPELHLHDDKVWGCNPEGPASLDDTEVRH